MRTSSAGRRSAFGSEFTGLDLGDPRRDRRLERVVQGLAVDPARSFPRQADSPSELEATYRFLSNPRVSREAILAPHVGASVARCRQAGRVIVSHDTTEVSFNGRDQLGSLSGKNRGFLAHLALAVDSDGIPLGALHVETMCREQRTEPKQRRKYKAQTDARNESLRWNRAAKATHEHLAGLEAIHVMDREADNYALLAEMVERGQRFVVRACYERVVDDGLYVGEALRTASVMCVREVSLSSRKQHPSPRHRKRHPARQGRVAKLQISATQMRMSRPLTSNQCGQLELELNLVHVLEIETPDGEESVEWRLWTTLPVTNKEEVLAVVDAYRLRWVIEEYFKALKLGCALERRQLESFHALQNALAIFIPVAWVLLRLRAVARSHADNSGCSLLSTTQLKCLRAALLHKHRPPLQKEPTAREVMLAVAAIGGHLKNNGDPGWQVLGRGLDDLLVMELGYLLAKGEK
jgi:hypothetical protein